MEECEALKRPGEDDQEGVDEFKNLGQVEDISPEEERSNWWDARWKADNPVEMRHMINGRKSASKGHDEGEDKKDKVMKG